MSIRQMLPIGNGLRECLWCGYPITAKRDVFTAHEAECLEREISKQTTNKQTEVTTNN
jgi:hypothetical protein